MRTAVVAFDCDARGGLGAKGARDERWAPSALQLLRRLTRLSPSSPSPLSPLPSSTAMSSRTAEVGEAKTWTLAKEEELRIEVDSEHKITIIVRHRHPIRPSSRPSTLLPSAAHLTLLFPSPVAAWYVRGVWQ